MQSQVGKLFEVRNRMNDLAAFQKSLQKYDLNQMDLSNLLTLAFDNHREKLAEIILILKAKQKNIFDCKLKDHTLFLAICKLGYVQDVESILRTESLNNLDKREESLNYAVQNQQRKNDRNHGLEIVKVLHEHNQHQRNLKSLRSLVFDAIQRKSFQCADFLIDKDYDITYQSGDKMNCLHVLLKNYSKKVDKLIINIYHKLVRKGVDDKKVDTYGKRPIDYCTELQKKLSEQQKSQQNNRKKQDKNYKLKSDDQNELTRNRNSIEYKQKDITYLLKLENSDHIKQMADSCIERITKEKSKEIAEQEKQRYNDKNKEKEKEKQKKKKIVKRVFSPDELKLFLNEEIQLFMEDITNENQKQKPLLNDLIQKITSKIKSTVGANVQIFGSFATDLHLLESDIDMVIIPNQETKNETSFSLMGKIVNVLQLMPQQVEVVKFIKTAAVPIIKIQSTKKYDGKKIDITFKDEKHNGLISVELIKNYLSIYQQLRPLVFVLKKFIYCTNIYDPYSGGLSSYGLILMIVAFLQNDIRERKRKALSNINKQPPSNAELLIGFLNFYGFKSNYISKKICILDPASAKAEIDAQYLEKHETQPIYVQYMDVQLMTYPNDWQPRAKLVIEDPLDPQNNIGRATRKIRQIKSAFEMAYVSIHTNKNCKNKKSCESYKRIKGINLKDTLYENYKRPCCIIKRMLNSTKYFQTS